ncbi:ABC transporter substrate-binding protein [Saccharopolyspora sp. NPDC002376]
MSGQRWPCRTPTPGGSKPSSTDCSPRRRRPEVADRNSPSRPAIEGFAPLWLTDPASWQESVAYLRNLGSLTGHAEQAVAAETAFRGKLADAVQATRESGQAGQKVVLMYGSADSIGVDTSDSLKGDLLAQLFGYPFPAKGADAETASNYSVEELLAKQPDVALVYSLLFSPEDRTLSAQLATR